MEMTNMSENTETIKTTIEESVEETIENVKTKKKPSLVAAIIFAVLAMLAFLAVQIVATFAYSTIEGAKLLAQYADDIEGYSLAIMSRASDQTFLSMATAIAEIALCIVFALWYYFGFARKTSKEERKEINSNVFKVSVLLKMIFLALGFYVIDIFIANLVALFSPDAAALFEDTMGLLDFNMPITVIAVTILAPIAEELCFRGVAFGFLKKATSNKWVVILVTAALFAIMHLNLMQSLYVIPLAIIMGYVTYKYQSVLPSMTIHVVNNLFSVCSANLPEALTSSFAYYFLLMAVSFFMLAFILFRENKVKNA